VRKYAGCRDAIRRSGEPGRVTETVRAERKNSLRKSYALLEQHLATNPWLIGDRFTAADAYLFTVTNWASHVGLELADYSALAAFQQRVAERPHVQAALEAEGLVTRRLRKPR
jgi:glutathione S-transferase